LLTSPDLTTRFLRYVHLLSEVYPILNNITVIHGLSYVYTREHLKYANLLSRSLVVEEYNGEISEFRKYFLNLEPEQKPNNPWIPLYWEQANRTSKIQDSRLTSDGLFTQAPYVSQTISSVFAFVEALKKAREAKCTNLNGLCSAVFDLKAEQFNDFIRNASFTSMDKQNIAFDNNGDLKNPTIMIKTVIIQEGCLSYDQVSRVYYENKPLELVLKSPPISKQCVTFHFTFIFIHHLVYLIYYGHVKIRIFTFIVFQVAKWTPSLGIRLLPVHSLYNKNNSSLKLYAPSQCVSGCICLNEPFSDM